MLWKKHWLTAYTPLLTFEVMIKPFDELNFIRLFVGPTVFEALLDCEFNRHAVRLSSATFLKLVD